MNLKDEIAEAIESLESGNLTMGKKCAQFESDFAQYIGAKHAIFVNSGSTANLLMMSVITNPAYKHIKGEVIVPSLTWSTTLWPIIQTGCLPVLVDCDATLNIDVDKLEKAITKDTKAIFVAHILGNGCNLDRITELARKHNLILLEDTCESLGVDYKGKKLGTFGLMGSYSFYYSHHITTIEGGMVVTDDDGVADLLRCMRAHGWTRQMYDGHIIENEYPNIDPKFLFANIGYSVRPTEIQGAFGIHQLKKLDKYNEQRKQAYRRLRARLEHLPVEFIEPTEGVDPAWFGFTVLTKHRKALCRLLDENDIPTRPVIAGNLSQHPALELYEYKAGDLSHSQKVMEEGLYIDCFNPDVDKIGTLFDYFYGSEIACAL